ncbi:hypothetical protein VNO78_28654 [Psophocarpus tetragonolobus]|uniref:CTLH domain-containing protein n=1 Tax=Psophocarpus tetragonolobus TaxID=3891 RepID=A0AAN9RTW0_PSOTE
MDVDPRQYEQIVLCTGRAINENDVHNIILSYLIHNCYKESSESFIACTGMKQPADHLENMEKRKRILHYALEGNALKAIELTEQLAQDILDKNKDLLFDLLSLHFVGLVCSRKWAEALEFAQTKLGPFGNELKYREKIEDFMSLLAYENPMESPMFHLISLDYRQQVADSLNQTILSRLTLLYSLYLISAYFNCPSHTAMERLIQQTSVVRQCLSLEVSVLHENGENCNFYRISLRNFV